MYVILIYIASIIVWGYVLYELFKVSYNDYRMDKDQNLIIISLALVSITTLIETIFFGVAGILYFSGYNSILIFIIKEQHWFLVKLTTLFSGIFLLLTLKEG